MRWSWKRVGRHLEAACHFAKAVWNQVGLLLPAFSDETFGGWLDRIFGTLSDDRRTKVAMVLWALWKTRNDLVWKNRVARVSSVVFLSDSVLENWLRVQGVQSNPVVAFLEAKDGMSVWSKPRASSTKINVDAAKFLDLGAYSVAGIARDSSGAVLEAFSNCKIGQISSELAEVIGVKEALSWIKDMNWTFVLLETHSLLTVQALRSKLHLASYFGSMIYDCLDILKSLPFVDIVFVKRSANKSAHSLACFSCCVADRFLLYHELDSGTIAALREDCI